MRTMIQMADAENMAIKAAAEVEHDGVLARVLATRDGQFVVAYVDVESGFRINDSLTFYATVASAIAAASAALGLA